MAVQTVHPQAGAPFGSTVARAERLLATNGTTLQERQLLAAYERRLFLAMDFYQISPASYFVTGESKPEELVTGVTIVMLRDNDTPPEFLDIRENALFALAIGNSWLAAQSDYVHGYITAEQLLAEKQSLVSVLQALTVGYNSPSLTAFGEPAGPSQKLFRQEPPHERSHVRDEQTMSIFDCIANFTNPQASAAWQNKILRADGVMSAHYHFLYGIQLNPVAIHVLTIPAKQLEHITQGGIAWYIGDSSGNKHIVLSSEATDADLEHEMGHHVFASLAIGNPRLILNGLDEAWTEHTISRPSAYNSQRAVLRILLEDHDVALSMATFYRTGSARHRDRFISILVRKYGLEGFLQIARMSTLDSLSVYGMTTDPQIVEAFLRRRQHEVFQRRQHQQRPLLQPPFDRDDQISLQFLQYLASRRLQ